MPIDQEIFEYLMQLAPHVSDRRAAKLLKSAAEEFGIQRAKLNAACEERDRFRKDSEALDWLIRRFNGWEWTKRPEYSDCPEHLRNRLEGKKT